MTTIPELDTIECSDALAYMRRLPDASVDLIVTDPPYGLGGRIFEFPLRQYAAINEQWDMDVPLKWLAQVDRVLHVGGILIVFGVRNGIYETAKLMLDKQWRIVNDITWFKHDAPPNFTGRMLTESTERILICCPMGEKWTYNLDYAKQINYGVNLRDVWDMPRTKGERFHPAQKPLALIGRLIMLFSTIGDTILDPFMGSGTTAIAARDLGRHFYGCDSSPEYVEIANKRLQDTDPYQHTQVSETMQQLSLFSNGREHG